MNINLNQFAAIEAQAPVAVKLIERALRACAEHERPATVTIAYKVKRDKQAPHIVVLTSIAKIKEPKSDRTDLTGRTDEDELGRWNVEEDDGQQKIETT